MSLRFLLLFEGLETVARLAHRDDVLAAKFSQLVPQAFDMGIHRAVVAGIAQLPNAAQKLRAAENLVAVLEQTGEELKLPRRKGKGFVIQGGPAAAAVDLQLVAPQEVFPQGDGVLQLA